MKQESERRGNDGAALSTPAAARAAPHDDKPLFDLSTQAPQPGSGNNYTSSSSNNYSSSSDSKRLAGSSAEEPGGSQDDPFRKRRRSASQPSPDYF